MTRRMFVCQTFLTLLGVAIILSALWPQVITDQLVLPPRARNVRALTLGEAYWIQRCSRYEALIAQQEREIGILRDGQKALRAQLRKSNAPELKP